MTDNHHTSILCEQNHIPANNVTTFSNIEDQARHDGTIGRESTIRTYGWQFGVLIYLKGVPFVGHIVIRYLRNCCRFIIYT